MRLPAEACGKVPSWHESASPGWQCGPLSCVQQPLDVFFHAGELFVKPAWNCIKVILIFSDQQINSTTLEKDYGLLSFLSSFSVNPKVFFFPSSNTVAIPAFLNGCFVFTNVCGATTSVAPAHIYFFHLILPFMVLTLIWETNGVVFIEFSFYPHLLHICICWTSLWLFLKVLKYHFPVKRKRFSPNTPCRF